MRLLNITLVPLICLFMTQKSHALRLEAYPWLKILDKENTIARRIAPPEGFERLKVADDSFANWLRHLPLKKGRPAVLLYDGRKKKNQTAHHSVMNIDVGEKNLQQCADAVIRLRAEFLYGAGKHSDIHFNFTSGDRADFSKWAEGFRPLVRGDKVEWVKSADPDSSYPSFRKYLDVVFMYAGTASLSRELKPVAKLSDLKPGDVFIKGGYPGHAAIVVEVAKNAKTGETAFLLAQSFMPAQSIHILRNHRNPAMSPWYKPGSGDKLETPEWPFSWKSLRRFK